MLPESLKSAFQLYKRDTNAIATWLANTANNNGYPVHTNGKEPRGRLKGKARKEATAATLANEEVGSGEKKQAYLLPLRDFVPLATFIATLKPQVHIPLFMSVTIDRVIEVRRTVSRIMGTKDDNTDEESDASHLHFVGVLEQVRDILKQQIDALDISSLQLGPTDTGSKAGSSPTEGNDEKSASRNPFHILNLYETTEQIPDSVEAASPSDMIVEYEPESRDKYDEACLAFMSLLKDVLHQRKKVRELWYNYRVGNVFLGPAAIGTNEAIEICRRMEDDVSPVINEGTSVVHLLRVVFTIMCQLEGQDLKVPGRGKGRNFDTYDISSLTMWNVGRILEQSVLQNRRDILRVYSGCRRGYDEGMDRASSTNKQKYSQDEKALNEILSDIRVFGIVSDKRTIEDEFTRGVHTLFDTNEITLWQCFAAQIYLDILHELHGNLDLAWSEMAGTSAVIKSSLASALEEPGDFRSVENWRDIEDSLMELKLAASEWETDPIARYKTERGVSAKPNQFLRRHPLYCGVWVHEMRTRFHEAGVNFASAFGYVHQTYQLYHALQQERLLGRFAYWMDMMTLFETQGYDTFFVGNAPTTTQGYLGNLRLKSPATDRAQGKGKKGKRMLPPNSERGQLKELGALSMLFKKRFQKSSRREMTAEYLQKIIESNGFRFVNQEDGSWDLEKPKSGSATERAPSSNIPATHLIICVTMAIRSEAHQMGFNLFLLHMDCLKILEEIRKTIDEQTVLKIASESANQKQLLAVVAMVFRDAAADKPQGLLQRAASVVSKHLLEPSSMASTLGMRDLGFQVCRCPQNTGRGSAATRNCMNLQCGKGL
ncbi:hypothetical protein INS49_009527 [Diaporthe citri]|uniref:uncharacterized protein n=1 Tax=Diaporthe citri TaxID=83186 RepID=UPI001C7FBDFF|nr:uncharacterized protein INS49_009527 [Diaporthe citri]KAG6361302.1 hypothetical protein INS49_009527 [Diaporthe citri]